MNILGKKQILEQLKKALDNTSIKLPSNINFEYENGNHTLTMKMQCSEPSKNMQTDGAAFEGWALLIKHYLCKKGSHISIDKIKLSWQIQNENDWKDENNKSKSGVSKTHYNRFLYRVAKFAELFDWFSIDSALKDEIYVIEKVFSKSGEFNEGLAINVIEKQRNVPQLNGKNEREVVAEYNIANDDKFSIPFKEKFAIDKIERQIPAGLFSGGEAKDTNRIFTGGASAIDLIGIDTANNIAKIFELKLDNNSKVGVISELFFYSCFIKDFIENRFNIAKNKKPRDKSNEFYNCLLACEKIESYILSASKKHILIHDDVLKQLSEAFAKNKGLKIEFKQAEWEHIVLASQTQPVGK